MSRTPPEQRLVDLRLPAGYEPWSISAYDQARRKLHELHGLGIRPCRVEPMEEGGIEITYKLIRSSVTYRCKNSGEVYSYMSDETLKAFGER